MLLPQYSRRTLLTFFGGLTFITLILITTSISLQSSTFLPTLKWPFQDPSSSSSLSTTTTSTDPITYIPFTFGWEMLLQTLRGYQKANWSNIVVVDNSWDGDAYSARELLEMEYGVNSVIPTPVRLRFAQLQGYLDKLGRASGAEFYFWSHTDVLIVPNNDTDRYTVHGDAMDQVRRADEDGTLGVLWFDYDRLSAVSFRAEMIAPWDPAMPQYGSDCDRYKRLRLAGLKVQDCEQPPLSVVHLHGLLSEEAFERLYDETEPLESRLEFVKGVEEAMDQYSWREGDKDGMMESDRQAKDAEVDGGRRYWEAKWGWGPPPCELVDRLPFFDVPGHKQEVEQGGVRWGVEEEGV